MTPLLIKPVVFWTKELTDTLDFVYGRERPGDRGEDLLLLHPGPPDVCKGHDSKTQTHKAEET